MAQWIRHLTTNQGIAGSSPARVNTFHKVYFIPLEVHIILQLAFGCVYTGASSLQSWVLLGNKFQFLSRNHCLFFLFGNYIRVSLLSSSEYFLGIELFEMITKFGSLGKTFPVFILESLFCPSCLQTMLQ